MNKKIKIIELLNKIANGEKVPIVIEYKDTMYKYDKEAKTYYEVNQNKGIYISFDTDELNDYVETLEDNIEEIEEIPEERIENCTDRNYAYLATKYNELVKVVKELRLDRRRR